MSLTTKRNAVWKSLVVGVLVYIGALAMPQPAHAEYADVVINNYADAAGMRPAVFPHWFHRIRFRCKVCHADLGFKFKAAPAASTGSVSSGRRSRRPVRT